MSPRRVKGHAASYYTTGGTPQGFYTVGAATTATCRCGWTSESLGKKQWATEAYRAHLANTAPKEQPR